MIFKIQGTSSTTQVGYLNDGHFCCFNCANNRKDWKCPVYMINIKPYSQVCYFCGELIVEGITSDKSNKTQGWPLCLFD